MPDPTPSAHPATHHHLALHGRVGALHLDLTLDLTAPWTVLFGPTGCGKSTVLRAIAGLTNGLQINLRRSIPTAAPITLDDLPPEKRHLAYAPQQAALFPHLTVLQNVAFAASLHPAHPTNDALIAETLALFNLHPLAHRLPRFLSGGERQRVSLARALAVPHAQLLLLDEPFAGVDRALRNDLLHRLQTTLAQRGLPVLSVTHDVDEVFLLDAGVVRLQDGHILAQGRPQDVLADEAARVLQALTKK